MNVLLAFLILSAPFVIAALVSWAGHRNDAVRAGLLHEFDDSDAYRVWHDADAARTRFEHSPTWPVSGGMDERR